MNSLLWLLNSLLEGQLCRICSKASTSMWKIIRWIKTSKEELGLYCLCYFIFQSIEWCYQSGKRDEIHYTSVYGCFYLSSFLSVSTSTVDLVLLVDNHETQPRSCSGTIFSLTCLSTTQRFDLYCSAGIGFEDSGRSTGEKDIGRLPSIWSSCDWLFTHLKRFALLLGWRQSCQR